MDISIKWNVCRVCLLEEPQKLGENEEAMKYIFNDNKLSQQIFDCSGVLMRANDSLPQKICRKCLTVLRLAVNFRKTCRNSDKYLQMVMQKARSATSLFKLKKPRENSLDMMEDIIDDALDNNTEETDDTLSDYTDSYNEKRKRYGTKDNSGQKLNTKKSRVDTNLETALVEEEVLVDEEIGRDKDNGESANTFISACKLSQEQSNTLENNDLMVLSDQDTGREEDQDTDQDTTEEEEQMKSTRSDPTAIVKKEPDAEASSVFSVEVATVENDDEIELGCQFLTDNKQQQRIKNSLNNASAAMEESAANDSLNVREVGEPNEELHHPTTDADLKDNEREFFYIISDEIKTEHKFNYENDGCIEVAEQAQYIDMDDESKSVDAAADETVEYLLESPDEQSQPAPDNKDGSHSNMVVNEAAKKAYPKRRETSKVSVYVCDICGNHFTNRNLLNFHMKIHRNEKNFECELCFKRFNAACNLSAHMRIHTGEKPYECQYCSRRFGDRSTHIKHERIHTNEKPYTCSTCGKAFSLSTSLKAHERIHTGEKPYRCNPCSKSFKLPHQLKAHLNTHLHKLLSLEQ